MRRDLSVLIASAALAALLVGQSVRIAAGALEGTYPGGRADLRRASAFLAEELSRPGSCRVVGTFTELSAGWARILAHRAEHGADPVRVDFPYPLEESRAGRDPRSDPAYDDLVARWLPAAEDRIVLIEVADGSPLAREDYRRQASWKRNLTAALRRRPELDERRSLDLPDVGLRLSVLEIAGRRVAWGEGWGAAEPWGRWATAERAALSVTSEVPGTHLRLTYAPFDGLDGPRSCTVAVDGVEVDRFAVQGPAWRWQERLIPLGEAGSHAVVLSFDRVGRIGSRSGAMPVESVDLVAP